MAYYIHWKTTFLILEVLSFGRLYKEAVCSLPPLTPLAETCNVNMIMLSEAVSFNHKMEMCDEDGRETP